MPETALVPITPTLDALWHAALLCTVCEQRPWTQRAAYHEGLLLCADCASTEPEPDE